MSKKFQVVTGSLAGAVAIHVALVACYSGGTSNSADSGVMGTVMDAARDVLGMETPDAHAQDATTGCNCPAPAINAASAPGLVTWRSPATSGWTATSHQISLPGAGTYLVTYTATAYQTGNTRPDQVAVRFNWGAEQSPARAIGGTNGVSASQTASTVTISNLVTVTNATTVRVEMTAGGFAAPAGQMELADPTLYFVQLR